MELNPNWTKNLLNWILNKSKILAFLEATLKLNTEKHFEIQKLNSGARILNLEIKLLKSENEELKSRIDVMKKNYEFLEDENLDLHKDHETFEVRLENAKKSLELADHTNKVKSEELNEVHYTLNTLREESDQAHRIHSQLNDKITELVESNNIWIKQHESDQKKIKSLTNKLKKLEKSIILKK